MPHTTGILRGEAGALPRRSCLRANANLRLSRPEQLSLETQHHDLFLTLRVSGLFLPIQRSRNMGPDLTEPGSNGDAQNAASTQGSSRDQTVVLSPSQPGNCSRAMFPGTRHPS